MVFNIKSEGSPWHPARLPGLSLSMTTWGGSRNWQHTVVVNFRRFDQQNVDNYIHWILLILLLLLLLLNRLLFMSRTLRHCVAQYGYWILTRYHWISIISTMEENGEPLKPKIVIS